RGGVGAAGAGDVILSEGGAAAAVEGSAFVKVCENTDPSTARQSAACRPRLVASLRMTYPALPPGISPYDSPRPQPLLPESPAPRRIRRPRQPRVPGRSPSLRA